MQQLFQIQPITDVMIIYEILPCIAVVSLKLKQYNSVYQVE